MKITEEYIIEVQASATGPWGYHARATTRKAAYEAATAFAYVRTRVVRRVIVEDVVSPEVIHNTGRKPEYIQVSDKPVAKSLPSYGHRALTAGSAVVDFAEDDSIVGVEWI